VGRRFSYVSSAFSSYLTFSYIGALQPNQEIYIKIYGKGAKQDVLGVVKVRLDVLCNAPGDEMAAWYQLEKEPKSATPKQPGQLNLKFYYPKVIILNFFLEVLLSRERILIVVEFARKILPNTTRLRRNWVLVPLVL
jgi:hypothetical protein